MVGTSERDGGAPTGIIERLTEQLRRIGRSGFWFARFVGKADGAELVTCAACGTITSRRKAMKVTPTAWGCSSECADQIAAEQAW